MLRSNGWYSSRRSWTPNFVLDKTVYDLPRAASQSNDGTGINVCNIMESMKIIYCSNITYCIKSCFCNDNIIIHFIYTTKI